jgi:hypothetical protein
LEIKATSGVKFTNEDQNMRKTHELILITQAKATTNMVIATFMKAKSLIHNALKIIHYALAIM